jgi:hypothetical protein
VTGTVGVWHLELDTDGLVPAGPHSVGSGAVLGTKQKTSSGFSIPVSAGRGVPTEAPSAGGPSARVQVSPEHEYWTRQGIASASRSLCGEPPQEARRTRAIIRTWLAVITSSCSPLRRSRTIRSSCQRAVVTFCDFLLNAG